MPASIFAMLVAFSIVLSANVYCSKEVVNYVQHGADALAKIGTIRTQSSLRSKLHCAIACTQDDLCNAVQDIKIGEGNHECHLLTATPKSCTDADVLTTAGISFYAEEQVSTAITEQIGVANGICYETFEVTFPSYEVTHYFLKDAGFPVAVTSFTFVGWIKPDTVITSNLRFLWAYGEESYDFGLAVNGQSNTQIHLGVNGLNNFMPQYYNSLIDGQWHFIGFTWSNVDGKIRYYVDGSEIGTDTQLQGYAIPAGGPLVFGQEMDYVGGNFNFDSYQSYKGDIAGFNFYDYVLTPQQIQDLSRNCYYSNGNLLAWSETRQGLHGNAVINSAAPSCTGL